jgi:hypothetical protein
VSGDLVTVPGEDLIAGTPGDPAHFRYILHADPDIMTQKIVLESNGLHIRDEGGAHKTVRGVN